MSHNLSAGHWRAAVNLEYKYLASVHSLTDVHGKKIYQQVISNGWVSSETIIPDTTTNEEIAENCDMPVFLEESLQKMTVVELRQICNKYNIKQGKRKAELISNIVQRLETVHDHQNDVEQIITEISKPANIDPAPIHDFYRANFNLIDLVDRRWYSTEEHHAHHSWQTKLVLAMLRLAVMNAWGVRK